MIISSIFDNTLRDLCPLLDLELLFNLLLGQEKSFRINRGEYCEV